MGLVTTSTQTHILLDLVCRKLSSVNGLNIMNIILKPFTDQKKSTVRILMLTSHLGVRKSDFSVTCSETSDSSG